MKKRGALSLWKAILLVITGLIAVAGCTVLGIYLTGGFEDNPVLPANINIEKVVDGEGYFNESLNRFEVASDFDMTISSNTEGVTQKEVTLSLQNGQLKDGYITDGIIKVPQKVNINTPFTVELVKTYNLILNVDWVVGGISTLYAQSSNILLEQQQVQIAVDVPVESIDAKISGTEQINDITEVVIGSTFTVDVTFSPDSSGWLFKDDQYNKKIFYEVLSPNSNIEYDFSTNTFLAKNRSSSSNEIIRVYTFKNSYYQKEILQLFANETEQNLSSKVLGYFKEQEALGRVLYISETIHVKVEDVEVKEVSFGLSNGTVEGFVDKYVFLNANATGADGNLQASIKDSSGNSLNHALMSRIGINISKVSGQEEALKILGGNQVIKVETTGQDAETNVVITLESFDEDKNYWSDEDNSEYYILPNVTPDSVDNYYWKFASTQEIDVNLYVNFFYEKDGVWKNFFGFENESFFTLSLKQNANEKEPTWSSNETIEMTINYNAQGKPIFADIDLADYLDPQSSTNTYRQLRYFIFQDDECGELVDLQTVFNCMQAQQYVYNGGIPSTSVTNNSYSLHELYGSSSVLTALKGFGSKAKIVVASIKTDADNNICYDENGRYILIKVSRAREVTVTNTLSIYNMQPTFSFEGITADENGKYYVSALNITDSGIKQDVINFELVLNNCEKPEIDSEKIRTAFIAGKLRIVCLEDGVATDKNYVTLKNFVEDENLRTETSITFNGVLEINENYFTAPAEEASLNKEGRQISLRLEYDDDNQVHSRLLTLNGNNAVTSFNIYYPQVSKIEAFYETTNPSYDSNNTIVVNNQDSLEINWGESVLGVANNKSSMEELNELLTFKLYDQRGKIINSNLNIYSVKFEETPADEGSQKLIGLNNDNNRIVSFASTNGKEMSTTLNIYVLNKTTSNTEEVYCYKFNEQTGAIERDEYGNPIKLASNTLHFSVQSQGISKIEKIENNFEFTNDAVVGDDNYEDNGVGDVLIETTVIKGDIINFANLIKVYTTADSEEPVENLKFYLDAEYLSAFSSTTKEDLLKMIKLSSNDQLDNPENPESIDDWFGINLTSLEILQPFKTDTTLKFVARDPNYSTTNPAVYEISITIILKSDLTITPNFSNYYEANKDYLFPGQNADAVFADNNYYLEDYLLLTSNRNVDYSWNELLQDYVGNTNVNIQNVFESNNTAVSLGIADGKVYLQIGQVYELSPANITIYFGEKSSFVCSVNFTLYINPNIIYVQEVVDAEIDLNEFLADSDGGVQTNRSLSEFYKKYKATDFIKFIQQGGNLQELELQVSYVDPNAHNGEDAELYNYIKIDNNYIYVVENKVIDFTLGQSIKQDFNVEVANSENSIQLDALLATKKADNNYEFITFEADKFCISFSLVYGGDSSVATVTALLGKLNSEGQIDSNYEIKTITYNGESKPLLLVGEKYQGNENTSFDEDYEITGALTNSNGALLAQDVDFISFEGNSFKVNTVIKNANGVDGLTLTVPIEAVVSKIGENFVYYSNHNLANTDLAVLLGDEVALKENNIEEEILAGQELLIWHDEVSANESEETTEKVNPIGFVYNSNKLSFNGLYTKTITVCEDAEGYIHGLAEILPDGETLKLHNLEKDCTSAYVVLKCALSTNGKEYSYYYRIKVLPNFVKDKVVYPYADDCEFLDINSNYYDKINEKYTINLNESFNAQNSKYTNDELSRFGEVEWNEESAIKENENLVEIYQIYKVFVSDTELSQNRWGNYFTYDFNLINGDGEKVYDSQTNSYKFIFETTNTNSEISLNIKLLDEEANLKIIIQKTLQRKTCKVDSGGAILENDYTLSNMIGSEQQYTLMFNSGSNYVTNSLIEKTGETETNSWANTTQKIFNTILKAGSEEITYSTDIRIEDNGTQIKVEDYNAYIKAIDDNLISSLKYKYIIKEGTYYLENGSTITVGEGNQGDYYATVDDAKYYVIGIWHSEEKAEVIYSIEDGNPNYIYTDSAKQNKITLDSTEILQSTFFYFDSNKDLHIQLQDNVERDYELEIGYYTDEGVVFKIAIDITSSLKITQNITSIKGAGELSYSDLFTIKDTDDTDITAISINLKEETKKEISDLVKLDNENKTLTFAHLKEDVTFNFTCKVTIAEDSTYSFDFTLIGEQSFDLEKSRTYDDSSTAKISGESISISIDTLTNKLTDLKTLIGSFVFDDGTNTKTITAPEVGEETPFSETLTLKYMFNDIEIFSFNVVYKYRVNPNVEVLANYPMPDGKNAKSPEYIATTTNENSTLNVQTISSVQTDFFNSNALFAKDSRVVVNNINAENDVEKKWSINISSISTNAVVFVTTNDGTTINKRIDSTSADKSIAKDANLRFGLTETSSNGEVTFEVIVNKVPILYNVTIVAGQVVRIISNAPNYGSSKETIYAEDLQNYLEKTIFKADRILQFTLNNTAVAGNEYYLKFVRDGATLPVKIEASNIGSLTNYDIGRSLTGWQYEGAYSDENLSLPVDIFSTEPILTSRFIAQYYDGTQISLTDDQIMMQLGEDTSVTANNVTLTEEAYEQTQTYKITIKDNNLNEIDPQSSYSVVLDIEFDVTGNADADPTAGGAFTVVEINAGQTYSLLSLTDFGIINKRTGKIYTTFANGDFNLQIYGLGGPAIERTNIAGKYDQYFKDNIFYDINYSTGISPQINGKNYIRISQDIQNGKTVDYKIEALGANNDGNHVLMKLTYTTNIGNGSIVKSHNLLFKVMPNSEVSFRQVADGSYIRATNVIENNKTIAVNQSYPYTFTSSVNGNTISFYDEETGAIDAKLYNSSTNLANTFTYTYTPNTPTGYNSHSAEFNGTNGQIIINQISMGERNFVVEATNDYGYKIKFYIKGVAELNPQLTLSTNVLQEGSTIAFGARYSNVEMIFDTNDFVTYTFTKVNGVDEISIDNSSVIAQLQLTFTGNDSNRYSLNYNNGVQGSSINLINAMWTLNDTSSAKTIDSAIINNCDIVMKVKFKEDQGNQLFGFAYNEIPIKTTYQLSTPEGVNYSGVDTVGTLSNLNVYGFNKNVPIDKNSAEQYKSQLTLNMKISKIDFYYQGIKIGETATFTQKNIITTSSRNFWNSSNQLNSIFAGLEFNEDNSEGIVITIPDMDTLYYEIDNQIENVQMKITLTDGMNTCELTENVTIVKESNAQTTLFDEVIKDGDVPTQTNNLSSKNISTIYNDTLEIVMPAHSSISFVVNDNPISSVEQDSAGNYILTETGNKTKIANVVTVDNTRDYSITEYVGISKNIVGLTNDWLNKVNSSKFYIAIIGSQEDGGFVFNYNGSNCTQNLNEGVSMSSSLKSTALVQHIEDLAELNGGQKQERLYFLYDYKVNNISRIYRYEQLFTIKPAYTSAVTSDGTNEFVVEDYIQVANDTETYYVLPFSSWANYINLDGTSTKLSAESPYKFYFYISEEGSAFVDENGTITTTKEFSIGSYYITLSLYVKVSGPNGNFEDINSSNQLKLGTFKISLGEMTGNTTSTYASTTNLKIGSNAIMTVPAGFTTTRNNMTITLSSVESESTTQNTYVFAKGETLNFKEMFDSKFNSGYTNLNYHLTQIGDEAVVRNNLNIYVFAEAGQFDCTFVVSRRQGNTMNFRQFQATIMIYESTASAEEFAVIKQGSTINLTQYYAGHTWYEVQKGNTLLKVNNATLYTAPDTLGITTKEFIAVDGTTKNVTINFYVYSAESTQKTVAICSMTTYSLSDLFGENTVYRVEKNGETITNVVRRESEKFQLSDHETITVEYVVLGNETCTLNKVEYKIIPFAINTENLLIKRGSDVGNAVEGHLNALLEGDFNIEEFVLTNGVATGETTTSLTQGIAEDTTYFEKQYLVTKDGKFSIYSINFYVYEEELPLEVSTTANVAYSLSNLDQNIRNAISTDDTTSSVTFFSIDTITQVENINLEDLVNKDITANYFVLVGDKYYRFNITFKIEQGSEA